MEPAQTEVKAALHEWQAARRAILAFDMLPNPTSEQLKLWQRLGEAEDRLMKL